MDQSEKESLIETLSHDLLELLGAAGFTSETNIPLKPYTDDLAMHLIEGLDASMGRGLL